jgi:hypothetical protein
VTGWEVAYLVLGLVAGGSLAALLMGMLQTGREDEYE